jgi:hypothetical protein
MLAFIKAKIWSGSGWLLALCVILVSVTLIYFLLHARYQGTDHKKLDASQLTNLDNVFAAYPDNNPVTGTPDTTQKTASQREKRNQLIFVFLKNEYNNQIDSTGLKQLDQLLLGLNNKDAKSYLVNHDIIVNDFFWFTGSRSYLEVLMWALVGVLTSLIYYVSLANGQALKDAGDADTGPFDVSEIAVQVSKMFYAPVCALVLVLGYNLLNTDSKMTDISIGKGLLLFSFICGFFSGRVIKFIDRLKDLVLPISDGSAGTAANTTTTGGDTPDTTGDNKTTGATDPVDTTGGTSATDTVATKPDSTNTDSTTLIPAETGTSTEVAVVTKPDAATTTETAQTPAVSAADITVNLQLSPPVSQSADGPDIIEGGFNSAVVTLQAAGGGNVITLTPPANDQEGSFTAKNLPLGKYTLLAVMAYKKGNSIINLSASQTLAISNATETADLSLDITPANG